jgi:hypothetical protein
MAETQSRDQVAYCTGARVFKSGPTRGCDRGTPGSARAGASLAASRLVQSLSLYVRSTNCFELTDVPHRGISCTLQSSTSIERFSYYSPKSHSVLLTGPFRICDLSYPIAYIRDIVRRSASRPRVSSVGGPVLFIEYCTQIKKNLEAYTVLP